MIDPHTERLMMGAAGAAGDPVYVDDVFSTYLYEGNDTARSINNGIDLAGEGGMTWIKRRDAAFTHVINDTVRGAGKWLRSNTNNGQTVDSNRLTAFNNNGFALAGGDGDVNSSAGSKYCSWSFRKQRGFFDVVTWTGNGSNRTIAHNLGSVPGCIMIKITSGNGAWQVYHRGVNGGVNPQNYRLILDQDGGQADENTIFNDTAPTATHFSLGTDGNVNNSGASYVAYIFAGGESTAATARSVDFDGSGDYLSLAASTDFQLSGDFTIECWLKVTGTQNEGIWSIGNYQTLGGFTLYKGADNKVKLYGTNATNTDGWILSPALTHNQYHHAAIVRSGTTVTMYINGTDVGSYTDSGTFGNGSNNTFWIGCSSPSGSADDIYEGAISNVRVVKGTAVYTSSFRPLTEPLKNITNTKLLCCNNASVTGSTVTPGTITANGDPTASTDSPFDDPEGFKFGEGGDQNIIKCGVSRAGSGGIVTADDIGWEPQWLLQKQTNDTGSWFINDSMMRWAHSGFNYLRANENNAEATQSGDKGYPTSQGFKFPGSWWSDTNVFIWIAIRRADGYVGKPAEAGTDAFALDVGNASSIVPTFDSGFPVDFGLWREPLASSTWTTQARLMGGKAMATESNGAEYSQSNTAFDSNVGWLKNWNSTYQSWMWKRGQGFDVVFYDGNGVSGHEISHSLNKIPEMAWIKNRDGTNDWGVYHKDMHGSIPEKYYMELNNTTGRAYVGNGWFFPPTSIGFKLGDDATVNQNNVNFLMMLFASVDGISKVGSYTGNGTTTGPTISSGFSPRFVLIKSATSTQNWVVFDTLRGMGYSIYLNTSGDQFTTKGAISVTSNSFTPTAGSGESGWQINASGQTYIYYAHA